MDQADDDDILVKVIEKGSIVRLYFVPVVFNILQNGRKAGRQYIEVDVVGNELVWMDNGESCRSRNDRASSTHKLSQFRSIRKVKTRNETEKFVLQREALITLSFDLI